MARGSRKGLVLGAGAAGTVLVLASAAFACTVWTGKMEIQGQVQGNQSPSTVTVVGGDNSALGMVYCSALPPTGSTTMDATGVGAIKVRLSAQPCSDPGAGARAGKLPEGAYTINYLPNATYDCMNPKGVPLGVVQVNSTGQNVTTDPNGWSTVNAVPGLGNSGGGVLATGPSGKAAICAAKAGSIYSIQASINII